MIKVPCSQLEEVRNNPNAFAQKLLSENPQPTGGSFGMFSCWQKNVKDVHKEGLEIPEAIKALQQRFMNYADNTANRKKQEFLLDRMMPYFEEFNAKGFVLEKPMVRIKWELIPEVSLTGNSPLLVSNEDYNAAYFFTESPLNWESQLKFPLLQEYLAHNFFSCETKDLKIGTYCLSENAFDLKSYDEADISIAIEEACDIFNKIKSTLRRVA